MPPSSFKPVAFAVIVPLPLFVEAMNFVNAAPEGENVTLLDVNDPSAVGETENPTIPALGIPASPR